MILRVVIADDHAGYRDGMARLLASHPGLEVVGLASDGPEALAAVVALRPDAALLDVRMPGMSGIEVCRRVREDPSRPPTRLVLITGTPDPVLEVQARDAGASALLGKDAAPGEICAALLARLPGD
jgi:DNA-binding NarL/FixJ family response regulator